MLLYTLLLIAVVVLLFYIRNKISDVYEKIKDQVEIAKNVVSHPKEIVEIAGATAADFIFNQIIKFLRPKKNDTTRS